jgi:4-hydroxythreonine-4-phosphate dehydrogenase
MSRSAETRGKAPILITMGEPAGIGPEIAVAAFHHFQGQVGARPLLFVGDASVFRACGQIPAGAVVETNKKAERKPGKPVVANGAAVCEAIEIAVARAIAGEAAAIVTAPINKAALAESGFQFPGHTEYLQHLTKARRAVMMLAGGGLRVVPLTIHLPLAAVPAAVSEDAIVETGQIVLDALGSDFGVAHPRLAVAGLNPHAGEGGKLGDEEKRIVVPALARLRAKGATVLGPLPGDTMFHEEARKNYDAALCMYHDQALIPLKTLAFWTGVNVTLGLPIVRTSPDHGTAFDIAGHGKADARSMIAAIEMAAEIADARRR